MAVPSHTHPELEDRISAEMSSIHTEIVTLRAETRRGFTDVVLVLQNHGEHLRRQGDLLAQILERLDRQNSNGDE
jgi:hypothetical protein